MIKIGSSANVKLNSFDDLFGTDQPQAGTEQVQEIALSELHEFKGHPFKVLDDEKMQETVESVREHGVLMPGIARSRAEGGYVHYQDNGSDFAYQDDAYNEYAFTQQENGEVTMKMGKEGYEKPYKKIEYIFVGK